MQHPGGIQMADSLNGRKSRARPLAPESAPRSMPGVTRREAEVVGLVARGLTNKAIASQLQISSRTVQTHLERMFKKLAVRSRAALVARVYMNGNSTGNEKDCVR